MRNFAPSPPKKPRDCGRSTHELNALPEVNLQNKISALESTYKQRQIELRGSLRHITKLTNTKSQHKHASLLFKTRGSAITDNLCDAGASHGISMES